jgi:hypothetical protein
MKRFFIAVGAAIAGCLAYLKLREHPKTAAQIAELERQARLVVDKAGAVAGSAKDQAAARAGALTGSAAKVITPVQDKLSGLTGEASNALPEPRAE